VGRIELEAGAMSADESRSFDALIVGAGFAGMYMLHRLRGLGFRVRVIEAGSDVGGTWYWNRYPGARCDIESTQYSYQFSAELEQEWEWTERYATQPEILRYARHVADRFELRRDIRFDTRIAGARYDEARQRWQLTSDRGKIFAAPVCILATGCLSVPNRPRIEGIEDFAGDVYHTGEWPHAGVDFTGRRVAVIGTGSSAIQSIPVIARDARHVTVFQRTASYAVPARNIPLSPAVQAGIKAIYRELRARAKQMPTGLLFDDSDETARATSPDKRLREYERRWQRGGLSFLGAYMDLLVDEEANRTAAEFVAGKIRGLVKDAVTAEKLVPKTLIGAKRLCVDIGYYETFNRPNVTLVDISDEPIERVTAQGVVAGGREHAVEMIVTATGFDAMTGALDRIDIRGRRSLALKDKWRAGPRTFLGLTTAGFPNLFMITGPGSPSVLTNMLPSIEQHVEWIADCLAHLRRHDVGAIEPALAAEDAWVDHTNDMAALSLRSKADTWYIGANVAGKPRVFMPYIGGFPRYVARCNDVAAKGYEGFILEPARINAEILPAAQ
jgi:cation diffusion facilitator CzcD-associated flavoprotein CzcO